MMECTLGVARIFNDEELQRLALQVSVADKKAMLLCKQRNLALDRVDELTPILVQARRHRAEAYQDFQTAMYKKIKAMAEDPVMNSLLNAASNKYKDEDEDDLS